MSRGNAPPNRHQVRVWIRWAIESALLEKVPALCDAEGCEAPEPTVQYARRLLAELRDPDSSRRTLNQIMADAHAFQRWVEARQKRSRQLILAELHPGKLGDWAPQRRFTGTAGTEARPEPTPRKFASPRRSPMWDEWLDG
jgi:hypothetical protein